MTRSLLHIRSLLTATLLIACAPFLPSVASARPAQTNTNAQSNPTAASAADLLQQAHALLTQVVNSPAQNRTADPRLSTAKAQLLALTATPDLSSRSFAAIHHDLATIDLLQGNTASAVLNLRRAELACPLTDYTQYQHIVTNLQYARSLIHPQLKLPPRTPASPTTTPASPVDDTNAQATTTPVVSATNTTPLPSADPMRSPIDWVYRAVPAPIRLLVALISIVAASLAGLVVIAKIARRASKHAPSAPQLHRVPIALTAIGMTLGALLFLSVPHQHLREHTRQTAIITTPNITPRSGPDDLTYTTASSAFPLGAEVHLLGIPAMASPNTEPQWVKVTDALDPHARAVWLPASAVTPVSSHPLSRLPVLTVSPLAPLSPVQTTTQDNSTPTPPVPQSTPPVPPQPQPQPAIPSPTDQISCAHSLANPDTM